MRGPTSGSASQVCRAPSIPERASIVRLGVGPGSRCIEIGAGAGGVAFWLAERVAPDGKVIATDLETDFLEVEAAAYPTLEVLRHDITAEDLPTGFDLVHARWMVNWLPDERQAQRRMMAALRPGGVLLDEEPDFPEAICPVNCEYGRQLLDDLILVGLTDTDAAGRCPVVRGGSPAVADFLALSAEKLKPALLTDYDVTEAEYAAAIAALEDPAATIVMPMTVAAWGRKP